MRSIVGIDDTDSREEGMCTTYAAALIADEIRAAGYAVDQRLLVRLNPAIEHKTRGNAAVAVISDAPVEKAMAIATDFVDRTAMTADPRTNPGVAAIDADVADQLSDMTWRAIRTYVPRSQARERLANAGALTWHAGNGRGLVGAAAVLGARAALSEWTYEMLTYRPRDRWGTEREVDAASVFRAATATYPSTWDTVDRVRGEVVCVPHTPGPVLFGIRGDTTAAVKRATDLIESEPIERRSLFRTNQGTDAHLRPASVRDVSNGRSYRVDGTVAEAPHTGSGGHVHCAIAAAGARLPVVAFEPTKRFRDRVRALQIGDRVTLCGEVARGTLKLEKFALRVPRRYQRVVPTCPICERRMESAGSKQGYRCRQCKHTAPSQAIAHRTSQLVPGWYEVPPVARRHIAKPLIRGGFDGPVHPE